MYNNIGKRDILIFPKFDNIDIINEIRNKYDRLANLVKSSYNTWFKPMV